MNSYLDFSSKIYKIDRTAVLLFKQTSSKKFEHLIVLGKNLVGSAQLVNHIKFLAWLKNALLWKSSSTTGQKASRFLRKTKPSQTTHGRYRHRSQSRPFPSVKSSRTHESGEQSVTKDSLTFRPSRLLLRRQSSVSSSAIFIHIWSVQSFTQLSLN